MNNQLWKDIQAQEDNLAAVLDHLYGDEYARLQTVGQFIRNDKPTVFIGMGSAEYLCMSSVSYLGQYGRHSCVINAADALYTLLPSLRQANVIINSRSGETVEIVKLGQALQAAGIPFLAVTNEPDSTLAGDATHILWSKSRKDKLVSINIVTAMMTTMLVLVAEALEQTATARPALDSLPRALGTSVAQAWEQAADMIELLGDIRPVYMLYRAGSKSAAYNGQLVIEEVARWPVVSLEGATFRQGPIEVVDDRFGAIAFVPDSPQGALNLSLARDIHACGGRVLVVGDGPIPEEDARMKIFRTPEVCPQFNAVVELVPAQILAYILAEYQGYEPGAVRYISKVIVTEENIPNGSTLPGRSEALP